MMKEMQEEDTTSVLKQAGIFGALTEDELRLLAATVRRRHYATNQLLFSEGETCEGLFIVATGRVRVFKLSSAGREHVLTMEGPGSSIAELPLFDGGDYPASAAAAEESDLLFLSRKQFRAFCTEHPEVVWKLLEVVGGRLRRLVGIIEELSFTTVRQRLIGFLLKGAKVEGTTTARGTAFMMERNHQQVAAEIGTVRELVSRNLARLQAQGFVEINGREVTIVDMEGLVAEHAGTAQ
jgi:CRP/FNR family transcriptional regulator